jgi:hypothetical protein
MLTKGSKVLHKNTKRMGICLGACKNHKGWYKVLWNKEDHAYRYEPEDLEEVTCIDRDCPENNPLVDVNSRGLASKSFTCQSCKNRGQAKLFSMNHSQDCVCRSCME